MLAVESCIVDILIDLIPSVYYLVGHSVTLENEWHFGPSINLLAGKPQFRGSVIDRKYSAFIHPRLSYNRC